MKRTVFTLVALTTLISLLTGCGGVAAPVPPTAAPKPVTVNNPPKTPDEVDAIDLMGKKVTVTYWHQRPQAQQHVFLPAGLAHQPDPPRRASQSA